MHRLLPLAATVVAVTACAPPPEAPAELSDLSRYLVREFDADDERVMAAGIANLEVVLADVDLQAPRADRSFLPADLTDDDVADLDRPDVAIDGCLPVALAGRSEHDVGWFGRFTLVVDQSPAEPSAASYTREFLAPDEPECFGEADCDLMETVNDIRRSNALYTVDFELLKDFRWIDVVHDGEPTGRRALVSRSWIEESAPGVNDQNIIVQTYTLDVFIGAEGGGTWRYHALYSEADLAVEVDDDITAATIRLSIDEHFTAHDAAIAAEFGL